MVWNDLAKCFQTIQPCEAASVWVVSLVRSFIMARKPTAVETSSVLCTRQWRLTAHAPQAFWFGWQLMVFCVTEIKRANQTVLAILLDPRALAPVRLQFTAKVLEHSNLKIILKNKCDDAVLIWCRALQRPWELNWVLPLRSVTRSAAFNSRNWGNGWGEILKMLNSSVRLKTFAQRRVAVKNHRMI